MAKSLKDKVAEALAKAVGDGARIQLEDAPDEKIGGFVLSDSFAKLSAGERQALIWKHLDAHLTPFERARITFVVTDTPQEYKVLQEAGEGPEPGAVGLDGPK